MKGERREPAPDVEIRVGTAGWAMPGEGDSHLVRYARQLRCCEINSTFRRRHRLSTYERWRDGVGDDFLFAVKVPQDVTHKARLVDCRARVDEFLTETAALGAKRALLLVQTPPSLAFDPGVAERFFTYLADASECGVVCEPRHASWFASEAEELLARLGIARVAADPATVPSAAAPGGWPGLRYYRWHGFPRVYYSAYEPQRLRDLAEEVLKGSTPVWVIFDNTTLGAGTQNALELRDLLGL